MDANDITLLAADRLETALERLVVALEAREARLLEAREASLLEARGGTAEPGDMVPRAEVERLSARLDAALGRLRALLGDDAGADL